jgi:superfamily II DNA or RNA helicase
MQLRRYQIDAIEKIRAHYQSGFKKVLLVMPTGTGKTAVFCEILRRSIKASIVVVRGKKLVDQASQRLIKMNVEHGVLQANHWNCRPSATVQVCSIDTLYRRKIVPNAQLIIIDEAHLATSESFSWLLAHYPDAYFLAVTATPNVPQGLRHIAQQVVQPISFREAVAENYLVGPHYYAPTKVDLSKVKIKKSTGEYDETELGLIMDQGKIYGDIITHWRKLGRDKPTLCFCVNVEHSQKISAQFAAAGIPCDHIDANTPDAKRNDIIEKLERGDVKIITNVGVLTTGVDIPCVENIIFARPTKSYNLYIQMLGRATRPYPGKEFFTVLDHANNVTQHGFMESEPEIQLDAEEKKSRQEKETANTLKTITCYNCYSVVEPQNTCPICGESLASEKRKLETREAELRQIQVDAEILAYFNGLKITRKQKKYKRGWLWHQMKSRFGEEVANIYVPKISVPDWVT